MENRDVVIVGGGIAGLTAAYQLRNRRIILLEKENRLGGRLLSPEWKGCYYNLGAQFIVGNKTSAAKFADALGVTRSSPGKQLAVYFHKRLCRGGPLKIFQCLPLPWRAKLSLLRSGLIFGSRLKAINGDLKSFLPKVTPSAKRKPAIKSGETVKSRLDNIDFGASLSKFHPEVGALYTTLFNAFVPVEPSRFSTLFAIHYLFGSSDSNPRLINGGMEALVEAWKQTLPDKWLTGAEVLKILPEKPGVQITFRYDNKIKSLQTKCCIVATPAPITAALISALPANQKRVLTTIEYGAYLVVAVFLEDQTAVPMPMMFVEGKIFSMLVNPTFLAKQHQKTAGHGILVLYSGDKQAKQLENLADKDVLNCYVKDLLAIFPALEGQIAGGRVQRWKYGQSIWKPGYLAELPLIRQPFGPIFFCGDYTDFAGISGAVSSGLRAASEAERVLS